MFFLNHKKRIRDLTDALTKATEKINQLNRQSNQSQKILQSMIEGVIAVDSQTRILSINPQAEKIFGISNKEAEGKFFLEAIRNNHIAEIIEQALKSSKFISQELNLSWPAEKVFQVNAMPLLEDSRASGCLLVVHDITELRKLEVMRRDFVANASHELKTPLTSIKGFVETLLDGAWEDKENSFRFLQIIQDHVNRLDRLINDLLDLSYLESSGQDIKKQKVGLKDLTDNVLSGFKAHLKKMDIQAENNLPPGLFCDLDKNKIEQVLTNLIDNSIKFNRQGGALKVYAEDLNDKIKVIIEDSGIGIPEKDVPRIFERFYRVDKARSRQLGGTGLGLAIIKHIVELHGGSTGLESVEGLGSKFWFTLPN